MNWSDLAASTYTAYGFLGVLIVASCAMFGAAVSQYFVTKRFAANVSTITHSLASMSSDLKLHTQLLVEVSRSQAQQAEALVRLIHEFDVMVRTEKESQARQTRDLLELIGNLCRKLER
jgi:hypothetical protein